MCGQPAGQSPFGTLGGPQPSGMGGLPQYGMPPGIGGAPGASGTGYGSGSDATNAAMMQQQSPGFGAAPNLGGMQSALQGLQQGNVQQNFTPQPQMGQFPPRQAMGGPMPPMGQPMVDPISAGGNFARQGQFANYLARMHGNVR